MDYVFIIENLKNTDRYRVKTLVNYYPMTQRQPLLTF